MNKSLMKQKINSRDCSQEIENESLFKEVDLLTKDNFSNRP